MLPESLRSVAQKNKNDRFLLIFQTTNKRDNNKIAVKLLSEVFY